MANPVASPSSVPARKVLLEMARSLTVILIYVVVGSGIALAVLFPLSLLANALSPAVFVGIVGTIALAGFVAALYVQARADVSATLKGDRELAD